ncbi:MAG: choice-of-anchor J domain-containing protein, partial [Bacteroidia bacterium]
MLKKLFYISLLSLVPTLGIAQLANWNNNSLTAFPVNSSGQINGFCRITQLKFHPTDANKMYTVTSQGGLFTTVDGGNNWTVAQGTETITSNCASICVDRTNEQIMYLGTGDPNYYSNGTGVYKSINGGVSFTQTTLTNCLADEILQHPIDANTLVTATNKGIYRSTDAGATWTLKTANNITFTDLKQNAATNSLILYACTNENTPRFYRSTDFGDTWTQITSGIIAATANIQGGSRIAVTPADPNVVYFEVIGGGGIILKSNDGGLNFHTKKAEGAPYLTFYDGLTSADPGQGNYNACLTVDRNDPSKLWLQSHSTSYSSDSGATWTRLTHWASIIHTDMHWIGQSPHDITKLYGTNDGGVWLSTDGGNTWTPKSNGLYAYEIANGAGKSSKTNRDYIIIGTQDNGKVYRDGTGWYTIGGGDDYEVKEFDYLPNGGYFYNKDANTRRKTTSGGNVTYGLPVASWQAIAFNRTNPDLGFVGNMEIYRTTTLSNGTPVWTQISSINKTIMAIHSSIADPNYLYVITNDAKIYVSTNALAATPTFTMYSLLNATNSIASIAAICNNPSTVYISTNNKVYVSTNAGSTWTNITYNLPSVNHRRILAEEYGGTEELVFIATNNAVYYKKAGQTTWTNYSTNLPARKAPTDFSMYDDGTSQALIRYASYGRAIWETPFDNLRAVTAVMKVSKAHICEGNTVQFTDVSLGSVTSWSWTFAGGSPATSTSQNPSVTYATSGLYDVTLTVSNGITTNTITKTQYIRVGGKQVPITEGFETISAFPINDWALYDDGNNGHNWETYEGTGAYGTSNKCIRMYNYFTNPNGKKDEIRSPYIDLRSYQNVTLTFDVAYARNLYYNLSSDTLVVLISTDCGTTWAPVYTKASSTLATAPNSGDFVPTTTQWRAETIDLSAYSGQNCQISFQNRFGVGVGNNIYLDNIQVNAAVVSFVGNNRNLCAGASTSIGTTSLAGVTYSWSPATGLSNASVSNPTATPNSTTTYYLTGTHPYSGMVNTVPVTITTIPNITVSPSATSICSGQTIDLTGATTTVIPSILVSENFNAATNNWTSTNTSTSGNIANAAWILRPNGYSYNFTWNSNDNSQFYLSNSDAQGSGSTTRTTLVSPALDTRWYSSLSLDFYHYYRRYNASDSAAIEVSTNGTTWTTVMNYTVTQGSAAAFVHPTISLNAYVGHATLYIRFRYKSVWGYYWGIDNVTVTGTPLNIAYNWTSTPAGFTSTQQSPTNVTPTDGIVYQLSANVAGCTTQVSTTPISVFTPAFVGLNTSYCTNQTTITLNATPSGGTFMVNGSPSTTFNPATAPSSNTIAYTYNNGCAGTLSQNVAVNAHSAVTLDQYGGIMGGSGITTLTQACVGSPIALVASTSGPNVTNYQWQRNGVDLPGQMNDSLILSSGWGVYRVRVTNVNACITNADTFSISFRSLPNAQAGTDKNICTGNSVTLGAANNASYSYSWFPTTGLSNPTISNPVATPANTNTTYTVTVSQTVPNAGGLVCTKTDAVDVTLLPLPTAPTVAVSAPASLVGNAMPILCEGSGSISLLASNTAGASALQWLKNGTQVSLTTNLTAPLNISNTAGVSASYTARIKGANNCYSLPSNVISATINTAAQPTITPAGTNNIILLCFGGGTSASQVLTASVASGTPTYAWYQTGNATSVGSGAVYTANINNTTTSKTFNVKASYTNGCIRTSVNKVVR